MISALSASPAASPLSWGRSVPLRPSDSAPEPEPLSLHSYQDLLRIQRAPDLSSLTERALGYRRGLSRLGGLGLNRDEQRALLAAQPHNHDLGMMVALDPPRPGTGSRPSAEVEKGLLQRCGQALRSELDKVAEKCLKTADGLANAAKQFSAMPQLARLAPSLGVAAKLVSALANGIRGASSQDDPKQMAADFAKAVQSALKLLEKTSLKNLAKGASKLLPGLGEAVIGWDLYQATQKARKCSQKGDQAGALAWSSVAALNSLALALRVTCDLAALVTGLTLGGAAPGTAPVMGGCEAVVGVLAGISEIIAVAVDD